MQSKFFILILSFLAISGSVLAQDKLLDQQGNEYLVKVLEISPDSVFYKPYQDSATTVIYVIPKSSVFMITYQNGVKDVFGNEKQQTQTSETQTPAMSSLDYTRLGRNHAITYFQAKSAYWATLGSTLYSPPLGLAVGAGIGLSAPPVRKLETPQPELLQNIHYVQGYQKQAKKQKLGKAAAGFGTGVGIYVAVVILIIAAVSN